MAAMRDLWHHDALSQPLPPGSWDVARRLVEEYRMADPAIVRAAWDPAAPLNGRELQLELRLYRVLSTRVGVRVTRVWDEERIVDDREARIFGYEYETLPGHVERGRMDYEVIEWHDDGAVEFRLHARSRPSGEGPLWVRIGFRIFGRREQVRFYFRCCERMARMTASALRLPEAAPPPAVRLEPAALD
jgi:uncharacterized protein (UPF0548 family)